MKLVIKDGKVAYLYKAGKDLVSGQLEASVAQAIVKGSKNKTTTNDHPGFPLCVDGKWFFPIEENGGVRPQKKSKKETKSKE